MTLTALTKPNEQQLTNSDKQKEESFKIEAIYNRG